MHLREMSTMLYKETLALNTKATGREMAMRYRQRRCVSVQRKMLAQALVIVASLGLSLVAWCEKAPQLFEQNPALLLGAAWYPEQWPETRWETDLTLMEQAHMHVVRVGEFAWSSLEPSEGVYSFDWLERAIRQAEKHHIAVVIGTPTDAPPAWLTSKYPETLRTDSAGHVAEHGGRRQFNYANPHYRQLSAAIAGQLAQHFGHDANVIGWQIGNEFTDESFDGETRQQFQQWLQRRYGSLDALNRAWLTAYWSQTYDRWEEIPLPASGGNPGLLLDHRRFVTDTWRGFEQVQIDAIRKLSDKRQFVTTNLGGLGWSDNFDHYAINEPLDIASWDDYVGQGHLKADRNALVHDFVRGWKRKNFWVMETQPAYVNWALVNNALDPGETRMVAWQAIGHGADAVLYWQWSSALNGQEQYHGAIAGPDGGPLPVYDEIKQEGEEFDLAAQVLAGTTPVAQVALLHSYDSRWAIDFQPHNHNYDQLEVLLAYYLPLRKAGLTVDVVEGKAPLSAYKVLFAPSLNVISGANAAELKKYVEQGGHLFFGPRSGMKDEHNALNPQRQPGPLVEALGGRVEQYYALDKDVPVGGVLGTGIANIWAEQLSNSNREDEVLLRYGSSNGWLDGKTAMMTRRLGKGRITYLGALLDPTLMSAVMRWALKDAGVEAEFVNVPESVEVCRREDAHHRVFILMNHGAEAVDVPLPAAMHNVLDKNLIVDHVSLKSQGVAVLSQQRK